MNNVLTQLRLPQQTDMGWIIDIPADMATLMEVKEGSVAVLYPKPGTIEVEILPPPSPELLAEINETLEELKDTFAELKRLGD
ncbi:MAG TPA: hypothetical protein PLD20_15085 [Blastocatellia bacterium]|nr:hypothetical protein [Blastocatellia bacterium]HMV81865.1 hypothetical protein [Blastocatellia bacterium]HMX29134.1 hypothetical protein [Blastocatellia bacterium]HMZ19258.1 hypothetical protein [Blastocatellia bacterium]HNG34602.1 hypothetical protein [Blastocatellia bacterium]